MIETLTSMTCSYISASSSGSATGATLPAITSRNRLGELHKLIDFTEDIWFCSKTYGVPRSNVNWYMEIWSPAIVRACYFLQLVTTCYTWRSFFGVVLTFNSTLQSCKVLPGRPNIKSNVNPSSPNILLADSIAWIPSAAPWSLPIIQTISMFLWIQYISGV